MKKMFNKIGNFFNDFCSGTRSGCIKRTVLNIISIPVMICGLVICITGLVDDTTLLKTFHRLNKIDD